MAQPHSLKNEAAKQARGSALNDYRADIEAGIADRQAQLDGMKADAQSATADRLAQIEAVRVEQANSKMDNGFSRKPMGCPIGWY